MMLSKKNVLGLALMVFSALTSVLFSFFLPVSNASAWETPNIAPNSVNDPNLSPKHNRGILLVGMSGLTPSSINLYQNNLDGMWRGYSLSALTPRSFSTYTCPIEGWMQLRTSSDVFDKPGREMANLAGKKCWSYETKPVITADNQNSSVSEIAPSNAVIPDFNRALGESIWPNRSLFSAQSWAVGANAGIPLANATGMLPHWLPLPEVRYGTGTLQSQFAQILAAAPNDILFDLDVSVNPDLTDPEETSLTEGNTDTDISRKQATLAALLRANHVSDTPRPVIIVSLSDSSWKRTLQVFALDSSASSLLSGRETESTAAALIATSTTRATGLTTMTDVRGIIVQLRAVFNPQEKLPSRITQPEINFVPQNDIYRAVNNLQQQQRHADAALFSNSAFYTVFHYLVWLIIGLFILQVLFSYRFSKALQQWKILAVLATFTFAFLPAALVLNWIPWWNLPQTDTSGGASLWAVGLILMLAGGFTSLAWFTSHPAAVLSGIAFVTLTVDIMLGSLHQRNGFMGSLVLSSRRYYGISNRTYLILIIAGIMMLLPVVEKFWAKKIAVVTVLGVGTLVLLVDALPMWGADFGGPPGILASFGAVAIFAAGKRLRWWHGIVWVLSTLIFMALIAWISAFYAKSSHIGNFWASLGTSENTSLIAGKIRDVLRSFTAHLEIIWLLTILAALIAGFIWLARHQKHHFPQVFQNLSAAIKYRRFLSVVVAMILGIIIAVPINDSGALMIKESFYLAVPALISVICSRIYRVSSAKHFPTNPTLLAQEDPANVSKYVTKVSP